MRFAGEAQAGSHVAAGVGWLAGRRGGQAADAQLLAGRVKAPALVARHRLDARREPHDTPVVGRRADILAKAVGGVPPGSTRRDAAPHLAAGRVQDELVLRELVPFLRGALGGGGRRVRLEDRA